MDYSFQHYLLAKQSVDDRALNRPVYEQMTASLPVQPLRIIEVGAGIGTMLARLVRWGWLKQADYVLVDEMTENIAYAADWLSRWGTETGLSVERDGADRLRLFDPSHEIRVSLVRADVFDFIRSQPAPADLLIAHAVLDLLPLPASLPPLFSLTKNLAWLTVNFDGLTSLEPILGPELDSEIERLYHRSMDARPSGGDSQCGRHLFSHLRAVGADLLSAGASDWVVHPVNGSYPADEAYFLQFILHFFEESLSGHPELDPAAFSAWLAERRAQVERGELVYIAHQMDFLVQP
ncbi:MAG: hypothetical protein HYZ25_11825 [Chloroflexi bacterium]|nr:hypothetical protein [Chloroflexota bacterium]